MSNHLLSPKRKKAFALAILSASITGLISWQPLAAEAAAAPADQTLSNKNEAQTNLGRQQQSLNEQAQREAGKGVDTDKVSVPASSVQVVGNQSMSRDEILYLLPELSKKTVNIHKLSKQIQLVNDTGAVKLHADFKSDGSGSYSVTVQADEKPNVHVNVGVSNTGNAFTGDWRLTTSYVNTNISHKADTFGAAYVTSPGHWDDVKQFALSYRLLMPSLSDAVSFSFSYSDINMGSVYNYPGIFDLAASGKSLTGGVHYQHNFTYTSHRKEILDFGIEHKRYQNSYNCNFIGINPFGSENDFNVTMLSLDYIHNDRDAHHSFTWTAGFATDFDGSSTDYDKATPGSDKNFHLWKAGLNYQYRTNSDWIAGLRLHGQYTHDNVVSTEQLGAGGIYSVRGFNERIISADTGYTGSLELYTPQFAKNSRFVLFTDFADLTNNNSRASFHNERLASAGIGYRYTDSQRGISLALDYAKIIDGISDLSVSADRRWNLVFSMNL